MTLEEITIKIRADISDAEKKVDKLRAKVSRVSEGQSDYAKALKGMKEYINARNYYLKNSSSMEVAEREKALKKVDEIEKKYSQKYGKTWEGVFSAHLEDEDTDAVEKAMADAGKATEGVGGAAEKAGAGFKKMLKFGLAVAGIRTAAMAVRKAIMLVINSIKTAINKIKEFGKAGMENLYKWESSKGGGQFTAAMDKLTSKLEAIKNSLGSLFANVIISIEPYLTDIMVTIAEFINELSELVAKLLGRDTFYKANTDIIRKWMEVNDETADNIEAERKLIAGLDKLNVLENSTSATKKITDEQKAFAKLAAETGNLYGLANIFSDVTEQPFYEELVEDEYDIIDRITETVEKLKNDFNTFISEWWKNKGKPALEAVADVMGDTIGRTIVSMIHDSIDSWVLSPKEFLQGRQNDEEPIVITKEEYDEQFGTVEGEGVWGNIKAFFKNFFRNYPAPGTVVRNAKGGVYTEPTMGLVGEYSGAHSNPEIVSPKSLMKDTVKEANGDVVSTLIQCTRQLIKAVNEKDVNVSIGDYQFAQGMTSANRNFNNYVGRNVF